MKSRRAQTTLIYQGRNITEDIADDLLSVGYQEGFGQADTMTVTVQDRDDKWLLDWNPRTGERMKLSIAVTNWNEDGDSRKLSCGTFTVDELEYSSPPRTLSIKGNSLPVDSTFIGTPHSRTWREVSLEQLLESILPAKLTLDWRVAAKIHLTYAEQSEVADLEYISGLCEKYGLLLKVLNHRLIVFDALALDAEEPIRNLTREELSGYSFRHSSTRTQYDACRVKYQNAGQGQEISFTYPAGGNPVKLLEVTETVFSAAEAEVVAMAALWRHNIVSDGADITLSIGNPSLYAGRNIELVDCGEFSGVYGIDASNHEFGSGGYQTSITVHKVIIMKRQTVAPAVEISIGDMVRFSGGLHYGTSVSTTPTGGTRTTGTAKVTNTAPAAAHPYHLIGVTSNVYGWVDASTVSKE